VSPAGVDAQARVSAHLRLSPSFLPPLAGCSPVQPPERLSPHPALHWRPSPGKRSAHPPRQAPPAAARRPRAALLAAAGQAGRRATARAAATAAAAAAGGAGGAAPPAAGAARGRRAEGGQLPPSCRRSR
jgi:hypothetical protein